MAAKKQNGRQITKLSITHSFLELQSPDFAWKFVWIVRTTLEFFFEKQNGCQRNKMAAKSQKSRFHSFLEVQSLDFAWKFVWIVRTNFEFCLKKNGR